jgi:hypothetical protein
MLTRCCKTLPIAIHRRKSVGQYQCKDSSFQQRFQRFPPDISHIYAIIAILIIILSATWPLSVTASEITDPGQGQKYLVADSLDYAEDNEVKNGDNDVEDDNLVEYLFNRVTSSPENLETETVGDDGVPKTMAMAAAMPQYMIDLYRKFASDRYSTPIANTVRSFTGTLTGGRLMICV